MPEQLAVRLQKDGFNAAKATKPAGEKALRTLLERPFGEKSKWLSKIRQACTYDTGSLSLPTARNVDATPCGFGGYGL
jgi:hypothetical protein